MTMKIEDIAKVCHEANRAYCETIGDTSQVPWEQAPRWQRESAVQQAQARIDNPDAPVSAQHEMWVEEKRRGGWVYGLTKDAEQKTHPCMVPYHDLPLEQKRKDALFVAVVKALAGLE